MCIHQLHLHLLWDFKGSKYTDVVLKLQGVYKLKDILVFISIYWFNFSFLHSEDEGENNQLWDILSQNMALYYLRK